MTVKPTDARYVLEVTQPLATALVTGAVEGLNLWLAPTIQQMGQRIAIRAVGVETADFWMFGNQGIKLPSWHPKKAHPQGLVGSVVLQGVIRYDRGKAVAQVRADGKATSLRPFKGLTGPFGWVLRQGSETKRPTSEQALEVIRAGYWDQIDVQNHLLWYVERYGVGMLTPHLVTQLERVRALRKDKSK